ncbi:MAG TPA: copper chaperone PCu(A)C [Noviherbaspirillum sp.]|nr:copper chaperone PCu(A)C [Noviherbaspirillum sp.]
MKFRSLAASTLAALLTAAASLAIAQDVQVTRSVARATVPQQQSAGAYVTLENRGREADRLVGASTPVAKSVELHTMALDGNVMRMREVPAIDVPAGGRVEMKPGEGFHLMLMGLQQQLKAGDTFGLTLRFERAGEVKTTATVESGRGGHHKH